MIGATIYGGGGFGASDTGALAVLDPPDPLDDEAWDPDASPPDPQVTFELVERDGTHVADIGTGYQMGWRCDRLAGSATITLQRTDPLLADLAHPRMLRVRYLGKVVLDGLIQPRQEGVAAQGEEAAQTVTLDCPGSLADFAEWLVFPWNSNSRPNSESQRFNCFHHEFVMPADWEYATELSRQDNPTPHWTGLPSKWPDGNARWIAGAADTEDDAEPGDIYGRRTFVTIPGMHAVMWAGDNRVEMFCDGVRLGDAQDFHGFQRVDLDFTLTQHVFSFKLTNDSSTTSGNPTGFLFTLHPIDDAGRLGDSVGISNNVWRILDRPSYIPGWAIGAIVNYMLDRREYRGGTTIPRSFSDSDATDAAPFPIVPDLSIPATNSVYQALEQLAESYIDIWREPGTGTLHVWNKGDRGNTTADQFGSGFDGVDVPVLTSLTHDVQPPYATTLLASFDDGKAWVKRVVAATYPVERSVQVPNVLTREQVEDTLDRLLELYGRERVQVTFGLVARLTAGETDLRDCAFTPFFGFGVADTRDFPDGAGGWVGRTVESISGAVDVHGNVTFQGEAGDLLFNQEERVMSWLGRMADGALGGRSPSPTSQKVETPPPGRDKEIRPLRFHRTLDVVAEESDPECPEESGRIRDWVVTIDPVQVGDVDVELYIDHAPSGVSVTVPAGDHTARERCNVSVQQDVDLVSAHCADLGFAIVAKAVFE